MTAPRLERPQQSSTDEDPGPATAITLVFIGAAVVLGVFGAFFTGAEWALIIAIVLLVLASFVSRIRV